MPDHRDPHDPIVQLHWPERFDLHVHVHDEASVRVTQTLDQILTLLRALKAQGRELKMSGADLKAALAKIDVATDNIAADIRRLKDKIVPGMTVAEVAEVQALADAAVAKLEGVAADPDNPDSDATPV